MTGLFANVRHNKGGTIWRRQQVARAHAESLRRAHAANHAKGQASLDRFAEALAETGTVAAAAESIGISMKYAERLFTRIRRDLGWQAQ